MVISEELRSALYPLGIIATMAFAMRFAIQWLQSEKAQRSVISPNFWWLSILGNTSLAGHSLIQGQFPVCLVQSVNGLIAGRNLNLMQDSKKHWKLRSTLIGLGLSLALPTLLFYFFSRQDWFRVPTHIPVSYTHLTLPTNREV